MRKTPTLQKSAHRRGRRGTQRNKLDLYSVFTLRTSAFSAVKTVLLVMILTLALFAATAQAEDYSNNIGFMKNPPRELKEKFPMCDQFLDVNWIRQFPNGGWVGTVTADVYLGDKKEQREVVVMQRYFQGASYIRARILDSFDVSESAIKGNELELLIKSSDWVCSAIDGGSDVRKRVFAVKTNDKLTEVSMIRAQSDSHPKDGLYNGLYQRSYSQFYQNVCVILANGENGWIVEDKSRPSPSSVVYISAKARKGDKNGR